MVVLSSRVCFALNSSPVQQEARSLISFSPLCLFSSSISLFTSTQNPTRNMSSSSSRQRNTYRWVAFRGPYIMALILASRGYSFIPSNSIHFTFRPDWTGTIFPLTCPLSSKLSSRTGRFHRSNAHFSLSHSFTSSRLRPRCTQQPTTTRQ